MSLLCLPCHLYCMLASSCQGLVLGEALLGLLQAPLVCVHLPAASFSCTAALVLATVSQPDSTVDSLQP